MTLTKEDLQAIRTLIKEEIKEEIAPIKADMGGLKADVAELKEGLQVVRTSQLKVELEQYPRITAALDGVVAGIEKNTEQDRQIYVLENKVENHDHRITALEYTARAK